MLNFLKEFKFWAAKYQNASNLLILRQTASIESFLPIGWRIFIWWKKSAEVLHYFGFDDGTLEFFNYPTHEP